MPKGQFPPTDWERLARVALRDDQGRPTYDDLIALYLPSIRYFLRRVLRVPVEQIDDLVQAFVTEKLLEGEVFQRADRRRGRFRNLLVRSLRHWVIDRSRGESRRVSAAMLASRNGTPEPGDASEQFDRLWAQWVVSEAIARTFRHCQRTGRMDVWRVFEARLANPAADGAEPVAYETLVKDLSLRTPHQAANMLITAKRLFSRKLEQLLMEQAGPDAMIDEELNDLMRVLSLRPPLRPDHPG